ncbi:hypothetical protein L486_02006 [Kwoniella mangroviensis CBS 10435]|uniref:CN hydrolase domain-containing protein n=1 Tax=Kwoniella mangroviensis CBS 10435 TaxID=1331196 RepID=A0A1B9J3I7_9TREE|nr:hypothetical protein L486_02006 [Kwoniella mangroviensis CBS 10435]
MPSKVKVKVSAVQTCPVAFDLTASLDKYEKLIGEILQKDRADLLVLPEASLSAYPRFLYFQIGTRTDDNREWFSRYVKSSVKVPLDAVGKDWLSDKPYLSIGVVERSLVGSTLWCTNLLFSPMGILLSKHRKLQPTAAERIVWSQGDATNPAADGEVEDNLPVVQTKIGKIGGLICWENYMPLARYQLYRKGVEIYTAPTADSRPTNLPSVQHIAQEGRCFVISVNQYHAPSDFPADYPPSLALSQSEKEENKAWSRGGTSIIGPLGQVIAGPLWDQEGVINAEIDLDSLHGARLDFDVAGHYSRHDTMLGLLNLPAASAEEAFQTI